MSEFEFEFIWVLERDFFLSLLSLIVCVRGVGEREAKFMAIEHKSTKCHYYPCYKDNELNDQDVYGIKLQHVRRHIFQPLLLKGSQQGRTLHPNYSYKLGLFN